MVHNLVRKLPFEEQSSHAILMYNNRKSFDKIVKECDQVWRFGLAHGNKLPRTQVNLVEDVSEEEEEQDSQAALIL